MICLDTNAVIAVMNRRPTRLRERFRAALLRKEPVVLPILTLHELWFGILKSERREANTKVLREFLAQGVPVLDFDSDDAKEAGAIRAQLQRGGTPIGPYDLLIAAQARRRGAVLVTGNGREFSRVPGLMLEDWAGV